MTKRIFAIDDEALVSVDTTPPPADATDGLNELDDLRLGLFTDLSHQLRTPITAMKLAMEGLFGQLDDGTSDETQQLADISRRNIDRIVALVENQLKMLEMILGEVSVTRRQVEVDRLVHDIAVRVFEGDPESLSRFVARNATRSAPRYLSTDPDLIDTILSCALCGGSEKAVRDLDVGYYALSRELHISVRLNYLAPTVMCPSVGVADVPAMTRADFEYRAYASALEDLGGRVVVEKDNNVKVVRIELPFGPTPERDRN